MSGLRAKKSLISRFLLLVFLTIVSIQSAFAAVFQDLFTTLGDTFYVDEITFARIVYWILVFSIIFFVGNKTFDYFNHNGGNQGKRFAMILALIFASISVYYTPGQLLSEVLSLYGGIILPILIILLPLILNIVAYRTFLGENHSTTRSILAALLFFIAAVLHGYLTQRFESAFTEDPVSITMGMVASVNLIASVVGFIWALLTAFNNGEANPIDAARNAVDGVRNRLGGNPPRDLTRPDYSVQLNQLEQNIRQYEGNIRNLRLEFNRILADFARRAVPGQNFIQVNGGRIPTSAVRQTIRQAIRNGHQTIHRLLESIYHDGEFTQITGAQRRQLTRLERQEASLTVVQRQHATNFLAELRRVR